MDNKKANIGLLSASPEKRYKSFLNTVTDMEQVWCLANSEGYATFDINGVIHMMVWPKSEFCMPFISGDEKTEAIEVHDFLNKLLTIQDNIMFMVFPNEKNAYIVSPRQLHSDILVHLAEIE